MVALASSSDSVVALAVLTAVAAALVLLGAFLGARRARPGPGPTPGVGLDEVSRSLSGLSAAVADLRQERALHHGQLVEGLRQSALGQAELHRTTRALHDALARPGGRGQWGERMADDVLRAAGFVEGVNYVRQRPLPVG